jgi:hypothetical protein
MSLRILQYNVHKSKDKGYGTIASRSTGPGIRYYRSLGTVENPLPRYNLLPKGSPVSPSLPVGKGTVLLPSQKKDLFRTNQPAPYWLTVWPNGPRYRWLVGSNRLFHPSTHEINITNFVNSVLLVIVISFTQFHPMFEARFHREFQQYVPIHDYSN